MAREIFQRTMSQAAANGVLSALAGVEISVYNGGTYGGANPVLANIYQARTGNAQGPAPEAAAGGGPNPFTTGVSGAVEFWLEAGLYDVHIRDTQVPARIAERTIQWNAVAAVAGGIPGSWISRPAGDNGLDHTAFSDMAMRQITPIGTVISWWRPSSAFAIPSGWEICDGRTLAAAAHDFGGGVAITLPDLRNQFVLGAAIDAADVARGVVAQGNITKNDGTAASTDGTGAVQGGSGNAPGIRGVGGAQSHALTAAQSGVNSNGTTNVTGNHSHSLELTNNYTTQPGNTQPLGVEAPLVSWYSMPPGSIQYAGDHSHSFNARNADAAHNNTPAYVGLLFLMKARRA